MRQVVAADDRPRSDRGVLDLDRGDLAVDQDGRPVKPPVEIFTRFPIASFDRSRMSRSGRKRSERVGHVEPVDDRRRRELAVDVVLDCRESTSTTRAVGSTTPGW
jgi:hypothetical protein